MVQKKTLVDSNSYFRLAQSIRPLLFQEFGEESYCLYVLKELDDEYSGSRRLKTKFPWVSEEEYVDNRSHYLTIGRAQKREISQAFDFIWGYVQSENKGPSRIDCQYLAHAYVLGIALVTDDLDMRAVAEEYDIKVMSTLELLHVMMTSGRITLEKVVEIVRYWRYLDDYPSDVDSEFRRLFGGDIASILEREECDPPA